MKARKGAKRQQRRLRVGESRVQWVEEDSYAVRMAKARVSKAERFSDEFAITEAEVEIDGLVQKGSKAIHRNAEVHIQCLLSGPDGDDGKPYFNRKVLIQYARLSDLPLIALALQGALEVGVRDGSFLPLPGVPAR